MKHAWATSILLVAATTVTPARCEKASVAHTIGGVVLLTGSVIVIGTIAIPVAVCRSRTETSPNGYTRNESPCDKVSDGTKAAWIAAVGVGLSLAVFGGILYFETQPKQPNVAIAPRLNASSGGATLVARF